MKDILLHVNPERILVACTFITENGRRKLVLPDGRNAADRLIRDLDERKIVRQPGTLSFDFNLGGAIESISVDVVFRHLARPLVTTANKEASNMLMNKLARKGITTREGDLVFQYIPGTTTSYLKREDLDGQVCACGHHRLVHITQFKVSRGYYDGKCDVEDCQCKQYAKKQKEAAI